MNSFVLMKAVYCRRARWWVCGVGANESTVSLPPSPIVSESRLLLGYLDRVCGCLGLTAIAMDGILSRGGKLSEALNDSGRK